MSESSSILAVDFGSVHTRVLLVDTVDGIYRLIARAIVRSTGGFPAGDIMLGLRQGVQRIEQITGRTLLDATGDVITPEGINRQGVDYFLATASGGRSLRAVLVGLMPGVSLESGRHAIEGSYIDIVDTISLRDDRNDQDKLNAILLTDPDLIFITGGTDGGAVEPLQDILDVVQLAVISAPDDNCPTVIYAGNNRAISQVQQTFDGLTQLLIADNVRPSLEEEYLRSAQLRIAQAFDAYKEAQGRGFEQVAAQSSIGMLPTAQSYRTVTRFLGVADEDIDTLAVIDVGSASSVLSTYQKRTRDTDKSQIRTDIGMGQAAVSLVERTDIEQFRRWIPFGIARADLMNYALNKQLHPGSIPTNRREMYIEHALLRIGIETLLYDQRPGWRTNPPPLDRIIGVGSSLAGTGSAGGSAMLLMDALQPRGITDLYTDPHGLIAAMGAISYVVPEAVVQLVQGGNLDFIGTVFSLEGAPHYGEKAGKYRIEYGRDDYIEGDITGGAIYLLELPVGRTATVRISGLRRGVQVNGRGRIRQKVRGGTAGVIIDARGRPIPLETTLENRARFITAWYEFVTAVEHPTPPDDDLQPPTERETPTQFVVATATNADEPDEAPKRRGLFGRRSAEDEAEADLDKLLGDADDIDLDDLAELNLDK